MYLIIDIGNTRTKLGLFKSNKLRKKLIWENWKVKDLKSLIEEYKIDKAILSSTGKVPAGVERLLEKLVFFIHLNHKTPLPIQNSYKTPQTLGRDRLAAVVGAYFKYPGKNNLVVDAGTCTTYDFIDKKGEYHGGNISPGIQMRLDAMHHFTAKLPALNQKKLKKPFGQSTDSCMRTGAQYGAVMEMQGFIETYRNMFGTLNVILTGGDSKYFAKSLKTQIFVNQNLVLEGLNKILEYNVQLLE